MPEPRLVQTDRFAIDHLNSGSYRLIFEGEFRGLHATPEHALAKARQILASDVARRVVEEAEDAFWARVAELLPEAKFGDLDPLESHRFSDAARRAVAAWISANVHLEGPNPEPNEESR